MIAAACSKPPAGRARWTLKLLCGETVRLTGRQSLSRETVRRRLCENRPKPWRRDMWRIPKADAAFVAAVEDVRGLCNETPDPNRPVICFDESPAQLISETRRRPGRDNTGASAANTGETTPSASLSSSMPPALAQGQGDRTPNRDRLRRPNAGFQRCTLPTSREDQGRARQPVNPHTGCSLQCPAGRGSRAHPAPDRVSPDTEACQLAQHGRDRRSAATVSQPAHPGPGIA